MAPFATPKLPDWAGCAEFLGLRELCKMLHLLQPGGSQSRFRVL